MSDDLPETPAPSATQANVMADARDYGRALAAKNLGALVLRDALRQLVAIHGMEFLEEFYAKEVARLELDNVPSMGPLGNQGEDTKVWLRDAIEWVRKDPAP